MPEHRKRNSKIENRREEEEEARQEQLRRNTRPRSLGYEAITSTPVRDQTNYPIASNRQTNRNVLFDPNPIQHSYASNKRFSGLEWKRWIRSAFK